jgi:hypothetical protein
MNEAADNAPLSIQFREDQRFRGPWTWATLAISGAMVFLVLGSLLLRLVASDAEEAISPLLLFLSIAIALVMAALLLMVLATRLQIEVNGRGLFVRLRPFQRRVRQIDLTGACGVRAVPLRALRDYGGFGLRMRRDGKAYIVSGAHGVRIDYESGYHILLSTHQPEALAEAVASLFPEAAP